jgi:acyl transferase domain-containing protein
MIRGTAINANGRTGGITRPSPARQEILMREAYDNAGGLQLRDTAYFELHGTGTPVGDPLEVSAVGNVFSPTRSDNPDDRLLIGSIKTNLGHSEGPSALSALMKVILALENGLIPPSINITSLNPSIDFQEAKVEVVRDVVPWPKGKMKRASINSFGFGGANGHCIVDHVNNVLPDYVKPGVNRKPTQNGHGTTNGCTKGSHSHKTNGITRPPHDPIIDRPRLNKRADAKTRRLIVLPFSAHNDDSLRLNVDALSSVVQNHSIADIAYTLSVKRSRLSHRSFQILNGDGVHQKLSAPPRTIQSPLELSKLGFVFTGQGAQWHAMGAQLFEYHVFRRTIAFLDYVLRTMPTRPLWRLVDVLLGDCDEKLIQTPEVSQSACTAVQVGLVDLLASWSIRPSGVVGHSSGEVAAAYASGHITAAEAMVAAYLRGQAVSKNKAHGAMVAVGLGPEQTETYLQTQEAISIAAINSPDSVTVSGDASSISELAETLTKAGVFNRVLRTGGMAYHSHHMHPVSRHLDIILTEGLDHVAELGLSESRLRYPRVPWKSSTIPNKQMPAQDVKASYWAANMESPVRFSEAVSQLVNSGLVDAFVEIGPHPALKGPLAQIMKIEGRTMPYTSTLKRNEDSQISLLQLAGDLFSLNAEIDLVAVNAVDDVDTLVHGCTAIDLPPYQYQYGPISYHESRASKEHRLRRNIRHDLLGSRVPGNAKLRPQWRNVLRIKDMPWLSDHRLIPGKTSLRYLCLLDL